jgi:hypothetical protein
MIYIAIQHDRHRGPAAAVGEMLCQIRLELTPPRAFLVRVAWRSFGKKPRARLTAVDIEE